LQIKLNEYICNVMSYIIIEQYPTLGVSSIETLYTMQDKIDNK